MDQAIHRLRRFIKTINYWRNLGFIRANQESIDWRRKNWEKVDKNTYGERQDKNLEDVERVKPWKSALLNRENPIQNGWYKGGEAEEEGNDIKCDRTSQPSDRFCKVK